jgi:hypothetical protein
LEAQVVGIRPVERKYDVNEIFSNLGYVGYPFSGSGDPDHRFCRVDAYISDLLIFSYEVIEQAAHMLRLSGKEGCDGCLCQI